MKKCTTSERLQQIMQTRGLKQVDILKLAKPFCIKYGVKLGRNDLSQYVSGKVEPGQYKLYILGQALNVNEAWLMGYDVPMERANSINDSANNESNLSEYDNIFPVKTHKIPLLGEIACGQPIFASEDRESYVEVGADVRADFCLKAKGDSMINARILDGDIVFIREQPMVENGEIAAVIIDDEATLKRVYYYQGEGKLVLQAENPSFAPLMYVGEELNTIRILGKAVAFQSDVK